MNDPELTVGIANPPQIDGIEILELLGKGGMSIVYKGRQAQVDRIVAVKVLSNLSIRGEESIRRFQSEAKLTSNLQHPNIIQTIAFGISKDGQAYLIMEYLEGLTLADELRKNGRLCLEKFKNIFLPILSALAEAHRAGIVHRDIKPGNIMLCRDYSGNEQVKLLDFGIAKAYGTSAEQGGLTQTGAILGSPTYMSPEQCTGKRLDERSDLYSLACVMYETLCGEPPFAGDTALEVMRKHAAQEPPTVSDMSRKIDIRKELAKVTLSGLAKDPAARPQSASAFARTLNEVLEKITLDKVPRIKDAVSSRRNLNMAVLAFGAILVFSLVGFLVLRTNDQRQLYSEEFDQAELLVDQGKFANAVKDLSDLYNSLKSLPDSQKKSSALVRTWGLLQRIAVDSPKNLWGEIFALDQKILDVLLNSKHRSDVDFNRLCESAVNTFKASLLEQPKDDIVAYFHLIETFLNRAQIKKLAPQQDVDLVLLYDNAIDRLGLYEESVRFGRVLESHSHSTFSKYVLAREEAHMYPEESERLYKEVMMDQSFEKDRRVLSHLFLGALYVKQNRLKEALEVTSRGMELDGNKNDFFELETQKLLILHRLRDASAADAVAKHLKLELKQKQLNNSRLLELWYKLHICLINCGRYADAAEIVQFLREHLRETGSVLPERTVYELTDNLQRGYGTTEPELAKQLRLLLQQSKRNEANR
ncbi:MAG: serine/threonine protein kinase [Candidatus Obscuribacterales bacterium]|jgi:serine/threonine protein kinase|nr:serine/threonine protein kinase [Candidatus Obscuribacterales bacterium]